MSQLTCEVASRLYTMIAVPRRTDLDGRILVLGMDQPDPMSAFTHPCPVALMLLA